MKFFKDEEYLLGLTREATSILAGSDEVGRGPLAGPVVSCAVALFFKNQEAALNILATLRDHGITDSKKLTSKKRQQILQNLNIDVAKIDVDQTYVQLKQRDATLVYTLNLQSPKTIDEINILKASLLSMRLAISRSLDFFEPKIPARVWIDGNKFVELSKGKREITEIPVVKGDQNYLLIALASIIAKEFRDLLMVNLSREFPEYGFHQHAGYGTKMHIENIKKFGVSMVHRKTFVKNFVSGNEHEYR